MKLTVFAILLLMGLPAATAAAERVALLIGVSEYQSVDPLINPKNDAADIAISFQKLGFETITTLDPTRGELIEALKVFKNKIQTAKIAAFFYAGHAIQVNGENYLIPIDAAVKNTDNLDNELIMLSTIQKIMETGQRTSLIFLDACRNNPFLRRLAGARGSRSLDLQQGLARTNAGLGTLISYSTHPGALASDGIGRNSPYSSALKKHLLAHDQDITSVLISVRNEVIASTNGRQIPWDGHSLTERVYLARSNSTLENQTSGARNRLEIGAPLQKPTIDQRCVEFNGRTYCD